MRVIFLFISLFFCCFLNAQKIKWNYDTSFVEVRSININSYKNQKDFQYQNPELPRESLWNRFWHWFWQNIDEIRKTKTGRYTLNIIMIVVAISAIVFFIVKVTGMNAASIFGRNEFSLNYSVSADDINVINFNESIENSIAKANYMLAIRLLYLQSLKFLTDKNIIDWKINKTNADYIKEMRSHPQQSGFVLLTNVFDYVWYGNKKLGEEEFNKVYQSFKQFQKAITGEEL